MLGNNTYRVTDKRIQNLQDIIGHGTLYGNDTIINQLNKLNELVKQNNQTFPEKFENVEQNVQKLEITKQEQNQQIETLNQQLQTLKEQITQVKTEEIKKTEKVEQTFKDNSAIIGSGKFQTNSQNITDAINELLGLINQTLNSNSIMIILDQLSDEMFANEKLEDQNQNQNYIQQNQNQRYELFKQQMQVQILNCGNVMTILFSAQNQVREKLIGEKHIRFGIQDKSMFIEEMQLKDNTIPDIRYEWTLQQENLEQPAGFYVVYDHSPQIIKSYNLTLLKNLPDGSIIGSQFNEKCMSEVDISDRLELKNLIFNKVKFNCSFEFHNCKFFGCEFQLKYNKKISQFWDSNVVGSYVFVPKFPENQNGQEVQLEFQKCSIIESKVESYHLYFINEEQLTPEELSHIKVMSNEFTLIRQIQEPFSWQLSTMTPQDFIDCDFIMVDPIQQSTCELYIDAKTIRAQNCSFQVKSVKEELSKNGLITVEGGELNRCKLSAENMKFFVDEGLTIKDSLLKSKNQYTIEGNEQKFVSENNIQML